MNAGYDMAVAEVVNTTGGSGVNWAFLGVIAMKKRDF